MRFDAVVLDFDGVLAESVDVKTRAFAALYAGHGPEVVEQVVAYHLRHGGISRFEKFRHYHEHLLGKPLSTSEEADLGTRFAALVEEAVVRAPWVAGAREFLDAHHARLPLFVASGTPHDELQRVVQQRGMAHYFAGVRGSPATKGAIISTILASHGLTRTRVLMVGDSSTDYDGAMQAGVAFLGIASAAPHAFPAEIPVLPDLTGLGSFIADSMATCLPAAQKA